MHFWISVLDEVLNQKFLQFLKNAQESVLNESMTKRKPTGMNQFKYLSTLDY